MRTFSTSIAFVLSLAACRSSESRPIAGSLLVEHHWIARGTMLRVKVSAATDDAPLTKFFVRAYRDANGDGRWADDEDAGYAQGTFAPPTSFAELPLMIRSGTGALRVRWEATTLSGDTKGEIALEQD